MGRTVTAFLVAPLWVPLAVLCLVVLGGGGELGIAIAVMSGVTTYAAMFALGFPIFMLIWWCKLTGPWIAAVVGYIVGILSSQALMICLGLSLVDAKGGNVDKAIHNVILGVFNTKISPEDLPILLGPGLIGIPVGVTLWLIARPDRPRTTN